MFILFFYFIIFFFIFVEDLANFRDFRYFEISTDCHHRRSSSAANFMAIFGRSFCEPTKILNVRKLLISITFTGTAKSNIDICRVSPLSVILKSSQWICTKKKIILHSQWTYIILVSKGLKVEGKKFNFS